MQFMVLLSVVLYTTLILISFLCFDAPEICIVGNKIDMEDERDIPTSTGEEFAQSVRALFTETTAKDSTGIHQLHRLTQSRHDTK